MHMEEEDLMYAKTVLESNSKDWWDDLSENEKASIEEGIAQSERGEGIPHAEVMKRFDKWR